MSEYYKAGKNHTSLPDALWFIYMIYLKGSSKKHSEPTRETSETRYASCLRTRRR